MEEVAINLTIQPLSRQITNCRTICQINSHTVKKVLGRTIDFPTWGSGKGTENSQGILLWRPVRFDYRTYTGQGKQTLGGHKQNLVPTRAQEKGAVTLQELIQTCLWVSRSLWQKCGFAMACCRVGTLSAAMHAWDLWKEVAIIFITSTIVWFQIKQQRRTHSPAHQQKIGLKIYWAWPHPSKKLSPQSVSPIRKRPQASYPYPSEGRQNENHNHKKWIKLITWTIALSNSMKLWAMCRATKDRRVMVESSDKSC